jgi:hypothetical protein
VSVGGEWMTFKSVVTGAGRGNEEGKQSEGLEKATRGG